MIGSSCYYGVLIGVLITDTVFQINSFTDQTCQVLKTWQVFGNDLSEHI